MNLAQATDLAKAASDLTNAESVSELQRALIVVLIGLVVFFFFKWQKSETANDERMQKQIDTLMAAGNTTQKGSGGA